jgi:hypothetical protein
MTNPTDRDSRISIPKEGIINARFKDGVQEITKIDNMTKPTDKKQIEEAEDFFRCQCPSKDIIYNHCPKHGDCHCDLPNRLAILLATKDAIPNQ